MTKWMCYFIIFQAVDLYTGYGAFGKSRHLNSKYVDLLSSFNDDRIEAREKSAQTDPFPLLVAADRDPQQTWSNSSSHDHAGSNPLSNEPYSSEAIPPVTTEQTLVTLDIVSSTNIAYQDVYADPVLIYRLTWHPFSKVLRCYPLKSSLMLY